MQNKLHHKFHTKLISYDQFMEYKLYDLIEGYLIYPTLGYQH